MNIEPKTTTTKQLGRAISAHVSDAYKLGQDFGRGHCSVKSKANVKSNQT